MMKRWVPLGVLGCGVGDGTWREFDASVHWFRSQNLAWQNGGDFGVMQCRWMARSNWEGGGQGPRFPTQTHTTGDVGWCGEGPRHFAACLAQAMR